MLSGNLRSCIEKPLPKLLTENKSKGELRAAFLTKKIWPKDHTIKIQLLESADKVQWTPLEKLKNTSIDGSNIVPDPLENKVREMKNINQILQTIITERIQPIIGLSFEFVSMGGDIRIGFNTEEGSYSLVGTDCIRTGAPRKTMNFGWFDVSTIIHEFCHSLGMIHEHQNPRGEPIKWDVNAVHKWARNTQGWDNQTTDTNIINRYDIDQVNGSNFDPKSIMLYFFPPILTLDKKGTNMNCWLSPIDVEWLSKMYPGGRMTPIEFYKYAYDSTISANMLEFIKPVSNYKWYIITLLVFVIMCVIVYFYYSKQKLKTKLILATNIPKVQYQYIPQQFKPKINPPPPITTPSPPPSITTPSPPPTPPITTPSPPPSITTPSPPPSITTPSPPPTPIIDLPPVPPIKPLQRQPQIDVPREYVGNYPYGKILL
jgi:hypothetical protein